MIESYCLNKIIIFTGNQLGEYIKDFSPLHYDSVELHKRHTVSKRSLYAKVVNLQVNHNDRYVYTIHSALLALSTSTK